MSQVFRATRTVEFSDTDAAGIAHFSAFVRFMEQAEHEFLRSLGRSVVLELEDDWHLSWPRVHVDCDFKGTAKFEDQLEIGVRIRKLGTKSITYDFQIMRDGTTIAHGSLASVCCRVKPGSPLESVPIPNDMRDDLNAYVIVPENQTKD